MPGVDLNLSLPLVGDSLATIVAKFNVALAAIEDDLAARVTSGELDINTTLSLGGNPLTNVGGVRLLGGGSSVVGTLYMDEELQVVTSYGTVQLTSLGTINVASTGTITGDYGGANPAAVSFNAASGEYSFKEGPGVWADGVFDDVVLKGAAGSVRLGVDVALAGTQTILFKSLPTSGSSLLVYQAASSTVIDGATASGVMSLPVVLTVVDLKFTTALRTAIPAAAAVTGTGGPTFGATTMVWTVGTSTTRLSYPITLPENCRITGWKALVTKTSASGVIGAELYRVTSASGARVKIGSTQSNGGVSPGDVTLTEAGLTETMAVGNSYTIQVFGGGTTGDYFNDVEVTYTRP